MTAPIVPLPVSVAPELPFSFQALKGRLVGISDRVLEEHFAVYQRSILELGQIQQTYPRVSWVSPPEAVGIQPAEVQQVLSTPISMLLLSLEGGRIGALLTQLRAEVNAKGISYWPNFYLGDDDFWTTDRANSINIPWYLGADNVWQIVAARERALSDDVVLQILRHEYAHALLYAFQGWRSRQWQEAFGDIDKPYGDMFDPDPSLSLDFVEHLARPGSVGLLHYAQKHPDEDWAETFATWIGGEWHSQFVQGSDVRRKKIATVEDLVKSGAFYGPPIVRSLGKPSPREQITMTVGEYLGAGPEDFSLHSALLRCEPGVYSEGVLHEIYFEGLGGWDASGPAIVMREFYVFATMAFGTFASWQLDMRAISGSSFGWAVTAWDPREQRVRNFLVDAGGRGVPPGCSILIACCLSEHAYIGDYGAGGKYLYLAAWFRNINWSVVDARLSRARAAAALPVGHQFAMVVPTGGSSCARCSFVSEDGLRCGNPGFLTWSRSDVLPAPADSYCCDNYSIRLELAPVDPETGTP